MIRAARKVLLWVVAAWFFVWLIGAGGVVRGLFTIAVWILLAYVVARALPAVRSDLAWFRSHRPALPRRHRGDYL